MLYKIASRLIRRRLCGTVTPRNSECQGISYFRRHRIASLPRPDDNSFKLAKSYIARHYFKIQIRTLRYRTNKLVAIFGLLMRLPFPNFRFDLSFFAFDFYPLFLFMANKGQMLPPPCLLFNYFPSFFS